MYLTVLEGLSLPLLGTTLGAGCVFLMKDMFSKGVQRALLGLASGVMVAASVWSLIIPAIERSSYMGFFSFVPAVLGFWLGVVFLIGVDKAIRHFKVDLSKGCSVPVNEKQNSMLVLAVVLHNIPEGMAVGVVLAAILNGETGVTSAGAIALATGIAIQNFPEGSIISMPLAAKGVKKSTAFFKGFMSGVVELLGGIFTILLASLITPLLPFMLSFAAGAMMYVVVWELIPEMSEGNFSYTATIMFHIGFTLMMALDVALG